jgi:hypothetical protein
VRIRLGCGLDSRIYGTSSKYHNHWRPQHSWTCLYVLGRVVIDVPKRSQCRHLHRQAVSHPRKLGSAAHRLWLPARLTTIAEIFSFFIFAWRGHALCGYWTSSPAGTLGSVPGGSISDLWQTWWHLGGILSEYLKATIASVHHRAISRSREGQFNFDTATINRWS